MTILKPPPEVDFLRIGVVIDAEMLIPFCPPKTPLPLQKLELCFRTQKLAAYRLFLTFLSSLYVNEKSFRFEIHPYRDFGGETDDSIPRDSLLFGLQTDKIDVSATHSLITPFRAINSVFAFPVRVDSLFAFFSSDALLTSRHDNVKLLTLKPFDLRTWGMFFLCLFISFVFGRLVSKSPFGALLAAYTRFTPQLLLWWYTATLRTHFITTHFQLPFQTLEELTSLISNQRLSLIGGDTQSFRQVTNASYYTDWFRAIELNPPLNIKGKSAICNALLSSNSTLVHIQSQDLVLDCGRNFLDGRVIAKPMHELPMGMLSLFFGRNRSDLSEWASLNHDFYRAIMFHEVGHRWRVLEHSQANQLKSRPTLQAIQFGNISPAFYLLLIAQWIAVLTFAWEKLRKRRRIAPT